MVGTMTHHALLYRAPAVSHETAVPLLPLLNATEVEYVEIDAFGIDDVRALTSLAYRTPSIGDKLGVVVIVKSITVEAEQALLKLLEEPPSTTAFLFCVPESVFLLPTLLSRFNEVSGSVVRTITPSFTAFAALPIPARITEVGERLTAKDLLWQQELKQGLLAYLASSKTKLPAAVMATLYYVAEHLLSRGASNKQLLEELAFTLPFNPKGENGTLM